MGKIRQLSAGMINKIAAGEVIERPASVVKELVENALDAGSTRIDITIEKAGRDRILIVDNGCGIAAGDLELALSSHATSKVTEADDLFRIQSFGFRGEALASIAEISQMTLQSRTSDSLEGTVLKAEGEKRFPKAPCGMAVGTSVEVRNLFFNTPVRLKYLKSQNTEFGHISETVLRLAIPNNNVHFLLRHNGKIVYDLPADESVSTRIGRIFDKDFAARLIPIDHREDNLRITGYVGHPDLSRSNSNTQYFFLNRRYIRDKALQHALTQGYRGLMTVGRFPVAFLMIELDPEQVDVNVHPTKMEVRFLYPQQIYAGFLSAVREKFLKTDLRSRPAFDEESAMSLRPDPFSPQTSLDPALQEGVRQRALDWMTVKEENSDEGEVSEEGDSETWPPGRRHSSSPAPFKPFPAPRSLGRPAGHSTASPAAGLCFSSGKSPSGRRLNEEPSNGGDGIGGNDAGEDSSETGGTFESVFSQWRRDTAELNRFSDEVSTAGTAEPPKERILSIHQKYLVMETPAGLAIIDQHALHERILYEKLRKKNDAGHLDSQRLLVPETIDLSAADAARALDNRPLLADFGLTIEPFGGNTILITGFPSILSRLTPSEIFTTVLNIIEQKGKEADREDLLDTMMHQTACKAAIKGGDATSPGSREELIRMASEEVRTDHCPHGRPTTLLFSLQEIDKMFKRT